MKTYDFAVIGSGFVGLSTARELAVRGRRVVLIDGRGLGSGASTGNTALLIHDGREDAAVAAMSLHGLERFRHLDEELGRPTGFRTQGNILLYRDDSEKAMCETDGAFLRESGMVWEELSLEAIAAREPHLNLEGYTGGGYREEWIIDPMQTIYGLFADARRRGMDWVESGCVTGFEHTGTRITGVCLSDGTVIRAEKYLVAAGAWTRDIFLTLNLALPNYYIGGACLVMERQAEMPVKNVINTLHGRRFAMERQAAAYLEEGEFETMPRLDAFEGVLSPDIHGNLIIGQRSHVIGAMPDRLPASYVRDMSRWAIALCPVLQNCRVVRSWISPVPFTHDGKPFFGYVAPYENLAVSAGYGSVLIMAPTLGEIGAALLEERPIGYDVTAYDPNRPGIREVSAL
ncbi:MAG: FAD-binding oxidoreductase [Lachnospiraceae bacterium]|nr:FAD-binding oxidoreductase [Lachnospiraceae bacterium]